MKFKTAMLSKEITIREARHDDIEALASLMGELGYPTSNDEMQTRFESISNHPDYHTIVAVYDNEVVGMAGLAKGIFYEKNGPYLRIAAFVVKVGYRKQGIGNLLINSAEKWAIEQGIPTILINSGNREERQPAYKFYHEMGYIIKSSGFVKELGKSPTAE